MRIRARSLLIIATLACLAAAAPAWAQPDQKFELGGQVSALRLSDFPATNAGLGGRFSYDLARWIAVESEFSWFPHDDVTVRSNSTPELGTSYHRRRAEAFFGPKMGLKTQRFGFFGKVRPGVARLSDQGVECEGDFCALMTLGLPVSLLARPVYRTEFALDVGGVVEFYPSPRTILRFDIGDTLIKHRSQAPPCWGTTCTSNNFSSRFGVGVQF
jgi:Outer membrane protein beta-barrel domain